MAQPVARQAAAAASSKWPDVCSKLASPAIFKKPARIGCGLFFVSRSEPVNSSTNKSAAASADSCQSMAWGG